MAYSNPLKQCKIYDIFLFYCAFVWALSITSIPEILEHWFHIIKWSPSIISWSLKNNDLSYGHIFILKRPPLRMQHWLFLHYLYLCNGKWQILHKQYQSTVSPILSQIGMYVLNSEDQNQQRMAHKQVPNIDYIDYLIYAEILGIWLILRSCFIRYPV